MGKNMFMLNIYAGIVAQWAHVVFRVVKVVGIG